MSGSIFGKLFQVSTWGESHGKALGVVIDGCPAGIDLNERDIQNDMDRRKPGVNPYSTKRAESDDINILSGVFEGKTIGTPISILVYNKDQHSNDYSEIAEIYRPGHADYTFHKKFGIRDYRGGGRSSGRETLSRVAAGAVAKKVLSEIGISVKAYTYSIAGIQIDYNNFDENESNFLNMPDRYAAEKAGSIIEKCRSEGDSVGGVIECVIKNVPTGLGEPVFDKLDASLSKAIFSIGAVKGVEIGAGFSSANLKGSENNDCFSVNDTGDIIKLSNNAGGILGGMSDGSTITLRAAFKPTPSIYKTQSTVTVNGIKKEINISGRHDPVIVPRAVVVVEAMAALTILDFVLINAVSKIDNIKKIYIT